MHHIRGSVKDYPWGIPDGLVPWTQQATGAPQAELWFGVHPSGPSTLIGGGGDNDDDNEYSVLADFLTHEQAPVLAKILAAAQPLSVQVHPNAHQAREMWDKQQIAGPSILADPFEKAEVLMALEPFDAFVGWRPASDAAEIIERIDGLALAASALHSHDYATAIQMIVERSDNAAAFAAHVPIALEQAASALSRPVTDAEFEAYRQAARDFPHDIGVTLAALLDFATIGPGDAVYLAPGIPHSYVRGIGFEVMTSSDNVLRLGLTGKPVFIDHALTILDFTTPAQFIAAGETIAPDGAAFSLRIVRASSFEAAAGDYRLVVALDGPCRVERAGEAVVAAQGTAVAITAGEPAAEVTSEGQAVVVLAPTRSG